MNQDVQITDHDLLVKLDTKVEAMMIDLKDLRDDTRIRITDLEHEKMDKVEANRLKSDADVIHTEMKNDIKWLQKIAYGGLALLGAVQFYLQLIK